MLRPPHTTHVLQGEDVEHFGIFKQKYQQNKLVVMGARLLVGKTRLSAGDLLQCAKEPWEYAFNMEHCLKAWSKIGVSPFTRCVYWALRRAQEQRAQVAARANVNPELLSISGMVKICFPQAAAAAAERQEGDEGPLAGQRKKRGAECNLHSTDLWDRPGGVTGDECFAIVQAKTMAKRAKEDGAKQAKEARAEARKSAHASANTRGAQLAANLKSEADVKALKVDELKAVLIFKGVALDNKLKKADLLALLTREIDGNYASSSFVASNVEPEPTAADFIDSDDDGNASDSSEWAFSQADEED